MLWRMSRWMVVLLIAGAGARAEPLVVAAPGLTLVDVDEARGEFYLEHLSSAMASPELRVVTKKEIAALLGLERQKELLGCTDSSSSCMAELGAALGASTMLVGGIAHVGQRYQVTLKLISATDGTPSSVQSARAESEEVLFDVLAQLGRRAAADLLTRSGRPQAAGPALATHGTIVTSRPWPWVAAVASVISLGVGAGFLVDATNVGQRLTVETLAYETARSLRDHANRSQTVGAVALVTGAVAAAAAVGLFLFGGEPGSRVALFVSPSGLHVGLVGSWP